MSSLPDFMHAGLQPESFTDIIRWRATQTPDRVAYRFLVDGEDHEQLLTYAELDRRARSVAAMLAQFAEPQARALLLYPPGLELNAGLIGCFYAGVIAVPAYPPLHVRFRPNDRRLTEIAASAETSLVLTTSKLQPTIERLMRENVSLFDALSRLQWILTDQIDDEIGESWKAPISNRSDIAFLQFTSGSTSSPRAAVVSQGNLLHNSALIYDLFGNSRDTVGLSWLPPYHDMGLVGGLLQPLYGGFPVTLMSPQSFLQKPFRWLKAITKYRATLSAGPNFAYDQCVRRITPELRSTLDLSSWGYALNGAEPVRHETLHRFSEAFSPCGFRREAFCPCYGLAEGTLLVSGKTNRTLPHFKSVNRSSLEQGRVKASAELEANSTTLVSSGRAPASIRVEVVNWRSSCICAHGEVGEVWISGLSVARGYWNRAEESSEVFGAYLANTGEGPFMRTGDLGFSEGGELFITGRLKDLIVVRGRNHYPQDIELTIEHAHSALLPAGIAVFSIDIKEEEKLVAMAEVERRFLRDGKREVEAAVRRAVCDVHGIDIYELFLVHAGEVPRTTSGKIRRHACRDMVLNAGAMQRDPAGQPAIWTAELPLFSEQMLRLGTRNVPANSV